MSQSKQVLVLYRNMCREANKFANYNFKEYSKRRIAQGFRENKTATPQQVESLLLQSKSDYELLKRQTTINNLFSQRKNVIE